MSLTLMYITNKPAVASIAQDAGVDRIFVDLEYIGKEERQPGMNTVKSHHTFQDIQNIRPVIRSSELMVRVNPIHEATTPYCGSEEEIETAIACGADVVMLPMFRTCREVEKFVNCVNKRAKVLLLVETAEASENIKNILNIQGIDEVHIGLNDLHLAYSKKFMFELLSDGTVDRLCSVFKTHRVRYGFGGIARIGYGLLPAEYIIAEHYRLGSQMAILSRGFCDANEMNDLDELGSLFRNGIADIRHWEEKVCDLSPDDYEKNHQKVIQLVEKVIKN